MLIRVSFLSRYLDGGMLFSQDLPSLGVVAAMVFSTKRIFLYALCQGNMRLVLLFRIRRKPKNVEWWLNMNMNLNYVSTRKLFSIRERSFVCFQRITSNDCPAGACLLERSASEDLKEQRRVIENSKSGVEKMID